MEKEQIIIDLDELNESNLMLMGANIRYMLDAMFSGAPINALIRGDKRKVKAFGQALSSEKRYMDAYIRYGLADARTHRNKYQLQSAITSFERATGLNWPVK
jgi:hypothetical protein